MRGGETRIEGGTNGPTRAAGAARGAVQQEQREGQVNRRDEEREAAEGAGLDKRQRGQDKQRKEQNASPDRGGINGRGRIDNGLDETEWWVDRAANRPIVTSGGRGDVRAGWINSRVNSEFFVAFVAISSLFCLSYSLCVHGPL